MSSFLVKNVFIGDYFSLVGNYESKGLLNSNEVLKDNYYEEKTFEKAQSKMQNKVLLELAKRNKIDLIIGGDLSNQLGIISKSIEDTNISFLGVYSACSSFIESLIISSFLVESKKLSKVLCMTSSHNCNSEKQFRFPVEYGSPKPKRTTYTVTGAVGCIVKKNNGKIRIESVTIGSVINSTIKDVINIGAVMAPGAFDTIKKHLNELNRNINYYDIVITGDLGEVGKKILIDLLKKHCILPKKYEDAGLMVYSDSQKVSSGASGPTVLPLVLFSNLIKNKYKKILLVATGSLHNPTMVNQKTEIPCISHAISIEVM